MRGGPGGSQSTPVDAPPDPEPISVDKPTNSSAISPTGLMATTQPLPIMALRRIGDSELSVFPLALGGSIFGWTIDDDVSSKILDRYHNLGGNFIDTADSYVGGRSEVMIGNWMRDRGNRNDIIIATKIGRNPDNPGLTERSIMGAVEASLQRLQTDHIDLLYFHSDDYNVPFEESLSAVDRLVQRGDIRYLAASNYTAERLAEARVLAANGLSRFAALQTHYNLMHRSGYEGDLALVAKAQTLGVMPYFALANGFLTGRYRSKTDVTRTTRASRAGQHLNRRGMRVLTVLDTIAHAHHSSVTTIALAWLLSKPNIVAPVASASRPEHIDALMAAASVRLSRSQIVELDRVSA
jgi:aryl-alcohol dehydrogenase-like predicted oxidoreductase